MGYRVFGVGDNPNEIESLNAAKPLVREPKLEAIMRRNLRAGHLRYTTDYAQALARADFAYISIDTPVGSDDESDLTSIFDAARKIGQAMSGNLILCISAQVPVGTCDQISEMIAAENPQYNCEVAYVPEFLRLGTAMHNFRRPDRVVIGAKNRHIAEKIAKLYKPLRRPIVITDIRSAEMAKHASNTFLATSISFINEIANLCEATGADAREVAKILKLDRRIGKYAFLSPGLGFAGGTLGREIRALQKLGSAHQVHSERSRGTPTPLMDAVWQINTQRAQLVSRRLSAALGSLQGHQIGILGLTYKAGTSTLRRAISLDIVRDLVAQGASAKAFDPLANLAEVVDLPPIKICADPYEVAKESSALVLLTEWADIASLDWHRLRGNMKGDIFLDTRNLLDPARMGEAGFRYLGIGR
jgi:UDPglucose 6-dehydrogenase